MGGGPDTSCHPLACVVMVGGLTAAGAGPAGPGDNVSLCANHSANMVNVSAPTNANVILVMLGKPAIKI